MNLNTLRRIVARNPAETIIIVPNPFEQQLLMHRMQNAAAQIICIDDWEPVDCTCHVIIEFPNDIPERKLGAIESTSVNITYTGEIL